MRFIPETNRHSRALAGIAVLAGVAAAAAVLIATRPGAGATPDTGHYLATADSLLAGRGLVRLGPETMASWPPLYPALLAAVTLAGIDMLAGARLLNILALAVVAATGAYWVGTVTRSVMWAAAAGIALVLSPPLVYAGTLALTDAPFAALQILALWQLVRWLEQPRATTLIACISCLALSCLMRYNGVVLIATAAVACLALAPMPAWSRLRHALVIALAAGAPLAAWIVRNVYFTGTVAGPRVASEYPLGDAVADAGYTVMAWFLPYRVVLTNRMSGAWLLTVAIIALAGLAWYGRRRSLGRTAAVCLIFIGLFLPFMILTFTRVSVDPLADRMLAPMYLPLIVAALCGASALLAPFEGRRRAVATAMVALPVALVLAVSGSRGAAIVAASLADGPGGSDHSNFNTGRWRSSPTLQWAGAHLRDKFVFASAPAALYIATRANSRPMPRKHARRSPGVSHDSLPDLAAEIAEVGEAYLVITDEHVPAHTFSLDELSAAFTVERVNTFPDGAVYRLRARPARMAERARSPA